MTPEEIIEMAKQAGMVQDGDVWFSANNYEQSDVHTAELEAFAKLVAAKEREACAKLVEVSDNYEDWEIMCGSDGRELLNGMAAKIRARGEA